MNLHSLLWKVPIILDRFLKIPQISIHEVLFSASQGIPCRQNDRQT